MTSRSMLRAGCAAMLLPLVLAIGGFAPVRAQTVDEDFARWSFGTLIGTYSGPSHENVLNHINNMMWVNGSDPGFQFENFGVETPLGLRLFYSANPVISFSSTYFYSQYATEADFNPHQWDSARSLTTNLHEVALAVHYELSIVRSSKIEPYFGLGINIAIADSKLAIGLVNTPGVTVDGSDDTPLLPDQYFEVESRDSGIGALGLAGLNYNVSRNFAINAEIQGIMGQVNQNFDFDGTLQYISPGAPGSDNPAVNDILLGSYPLDLNGLRLSVGFLIRI